MSCEHLKKKLVNYHFLCNNGTNISISREKMLDLYYPGINSKTYYALYAPAIARFLLIDNHNLFCVFKTAQVLSSKINTITMIMPGIKNLPLMNNENCLSFTLNHSKFQSDISVNNLKQNPACSFLNEHSKVIKTIFPIDFQQQQKKEKLLELQAYAQFVNACMHATMLTSVFNQYADVENQQNEYEMFYFNKNQKPELVTEIMNVLLFADNILEAKKQLEQYWIKKIRKKLEERIFWPEKIKREILIHCTMFYEIAKTEVPAEIKIILNNDKS